MRLTHLGHACLLVETDTARLLIDPGVFSDVSGVDQLDAVLVTHQHADHVEVGRLRQLLAASPDARLYLDPDTATAVPGLPDHTVVTAGERLQIAGSVVDVLGGLHAPIHGEFPGCTNTGYVVDDGALFHPGDSFAVPPGEVDVLAVAIDAPWLKLGEVIDYVLRVTPRVALAVHDAETTDPAKYAGLVDHLTGGRYVRRLTAAEATQV